MGSVQSDVVCPKCNFEYAWSDYYYKSGEGYMFCNRCGFSHSAEIVRDPVYGKKIKAQAEELIKQGNLNEALKITGNMGWTRSVPNPDGEPIDIPIIKWTDEEKINRIMDTSFNRFFKKDEKGNTVWEVKKSGGYGAFSELSSRGGGTCGHFENKWSARKYRKRVKQYLKKNKKFKGRITSTTKINGIWYMIDLKTQKRYEIPDKLDYDLWMKYRGGIFDD